MTSDELLGESTRRGAIAQLADTSFDTIIALQHESGAYPASPSFSAYRGYSWLRDGSFIADGVSSFGGVESASRFFDWCARILLARESEIARIVAAAAAGRPVPDNEMLPTRFTLEGADGDDEWWDFQLDGYGTWLWAVVAHSERHGLSLQRWLPALNLTADYLLSSWRRPCFDWWEESAEQVHSSTLGCIAGGLDALVRAAVLEPQRQGAAQYTVEAIREVLLREGARGGRLNKWLGNAELDASLVAVFAPIGVLPASGELGMATIAGVDAELTVGNGTHRYLADTFYGGGQWPLLSCMLGLGHTATGNRQRAFELLDWAAHTATADGLLPEQVGEHLLAPDRVQEWLDRWGTVATPLLWSHAMFIRLAVELGVAHPSTRKTE